jgi:hypothetical protein
MLVVEKRFRLGIAHQPGGLLEECVVGESTCTLNDPSESVLRSISKGFLAFLLCWHVNEQSSEVSLEIYEGWWGQRVFRGGRRRYLAGE